MEEARQKLEESTKASSAAVTTTVVMTPAEIEKKEIEKAKVEKIFVHVVKILHPDVNPIVSENSLVLELWEKVKSAHSVANLGKIQEIEILVHKTLNDLGCSVGLVELDDLDKRIQDVRDDIRRCKTYGYYRY